jgi:hypothetical protein
MRKPLDGLLRLLFAECGETVLEATIEHALDVVVDRVLFTRHYNFPVELALHLYFASLFTKLQRREQRLYKLLDSSRTTPFWFGSWSKKRKKKEKNE